MKELLSALSNVFKITMSYFRKDMNSISKKLENKALEIKIKDELNYVHDSCLNLFLLLTKRLDWLNTEDLYSIKSYIDLAANSYYLVNIEVLKIEDEDNLRILKSELDNLLQKSTYNAYANDCLRCYNVSIIEEFELTQTAHLQIEVMKNSKFVTVEKELRRKKSEAHYDRDF